jgi:predicted thioredoxin/glutaredoxin
MKTKKAIKYILKHPNLFTEGEIVYAKLVEKERKLQKKLNEHSKIDIGHT